MITLPKLFRRRIRKEWAFQLSVWKLAVDWIVALYIVIPALLIAGYHEIIWWNKPPDWFTYIPFTVVASLLYFWTRFGTIRYFIEEADQLALLRTGWVRRLMLHGFRYSLGLHAIGCVLLLALLSPLLHEQGLTAASAASLLLFAVSYKLDACLWRQIADIRLFGWRKWLLGGLLFIAEGALFVQAVLAIHHYPIVGLAAFAALVAVMPWLLRVRLSLRGAFHHDVERESTERLKYAVLVLGKAVQRKARIRRRRPLLFGSSNRLFRARTQVNGLTELSIKTLFRSKANVKIYLQLVAVCGVGILIIPAVVKWVLWLAGGLLLAYYVKLYWRDVTGEPYLKLFRWSESALYAAKKKSVFFMMLPGFVVMSALFAIVMFPWWEAILFLPFSAGVAYFASEIIASMGK